MTSNDLIQYSAHTNHVTHHMTSHDPCTCLESMCYRTVSRYEIIDSLIIQLIFYQYHFDLDIVCLETVKLLVDARYEIWIQVSASFYNI